MNLLLAVAVLAAPIALYWFVIRPRGAQILATYREAGGGWAGLKAVLWGFQTWWASVAGALAFALPELLTAASGVDFQAMLPAPWGGWVSFAVAVVIPLLRALASTPSGTKPSGEA